MKNLIQASYVFALLFYAMFINAQIPEFTRIDTGTLVKDLGNSQGSAIADFDNDGDVDLLIGNTSASGPSRPVILYKNERKGYFTKIKYGDLATQNQPRYLSTATFVDIDNDGDWDVSTPCVFYMNDGYGVFTRELMDWGTEEDCGDQVTSWVDIDNDGDLDCSMWSQLGEPNKLFLNNGDGSFTKILDDTLTTTPLHSICLSWADMDNDSDMDIFISNFSFFGDETQDNRNSCFINDGGAFTMMEDTMVLLQDTLGSGGASWGDYDNDGDLDLYVSTCRGTNHLYRNEGDGNFVQLSIDPVEAIDLGFMGSDWGDFDNDGDLDLFVTSDLNDASFADFANFNMLFENNGDGSFSEVATGNLKTDGGHSCTLLDYDNDGDLDILVPNGSLGSPYINYLYSNNGNDNNWIIINCKGRVSNASAIGTRIFAKAEINGESISQMRELAQQTGMHSISSPRFHFGLRDATTIDTLEIHWPSGHTDLYFGIEANQFYRAIEDSLLELDLGATNYIEYVPVIENQWMFVGDSTMIDLADHFRFVMGDTVPEITGDTLQFLLIDEGDPGILIPSLEGTLLTLKTVGILGSTTLQVKVTTEGFTSRVDFINILVYDSVKQKVNACSAEVSSFHDAETHYDHAIDGDMGTRWGSDYSDNQWIKITLDTIHSVAKVVIYWEAASAKRYKILASTNNASWDTLYDESSGDGETDIVFFEPTEAKYIQLLAIEGNTQWGFSIWELEIYSTDMYNTTCEQPTNILSKENPDDDICVYPNPLTDQIFIDFNQPLNSETVIEVLEYTGKPVLIERIYGNNLSMHKMDLSSLNSGIYIMRMVNDKSIVCKKLIKVE
ncbi:MAG: VCBS repeat-containing protein [Bacteroidales bacterium]|nr:MAG: VCBS repeat-containing protein [Bacteroidales bacterium]